MRKIFTIFLLLLVCACSSTQRKNEQVIYNQILLSSPKSKNFVFGKDNWIKFKWESKENEVLEYQIEISKEPNFEHLLTHKTTKKEVELNFETPAVYYWRVSAVHNGALLRSDTSTFELKKPHI